MTNETTRGSSGDGQHRTGETGSETADATAVTMTAVSTDYKVRGRKSAPDGAGVLGHNTATSGAAHGVEGVSESAGTDAAGVQGKATTASGATYGVEGVTESADPGAAAVRARAPNGGRGIVSTSAGANGLHVDTTGETAIDAVTDGTSHYAVRGTNNATNGLSWGVRGDTESTDGQAYGVKGNANATGGSPKGVGGTTEGTSDGAAGVHGEATASSGAVHGVHGETGSFDDAAAGVLGESSGTGAKGVAGLAGLSSPSVASDGAGVYGETGSDGNQGVFGANTATSGTECVGVYGRTDSGDSPAVTAENTSGGVGVKSDGNLEVVGHADVSKAGVSAYLDGNQNVPNISATTVVFDATNVDHFGGFDTSTGVYTVQQPGDYHVSFTVDWQTNFPADTNIDYELRVNGSSDGGVQADVTTATSNQRVCRGFSRTLFGLAQGDTLEVVVAQESGAPADLYGAGQETYLTAYKVG